MIMQADLNEPETPEWTGDNDAAGRASKVIDQTLNGPELIADDDERWPLADAHATAAPRGNAGAVFLGSSTRAAVALGCCTTEVQHAVPAAQSTVGFKV